jgi:hypothetical protein
MKDSEEIVEEYVESEFSKQELIQTDKNEGKDVESGISDNSTLDQCGALYVRHADSMDDSIRQLDIGLPPSADAVQTLLKYEKTCQPTKAGSMRQDVRV